MKNIKIIFALLFITQLIFAQSERVGIGTTSPGAMLHVHTIDLLPTEFGFRMGAKGKFGIDASGVFGGRVIVNEAGFVGLGVTDPLQRLHIGLNGNIRLDGTNTFTTINQYDGGSLNHAILQIDPIPGDNASYSAVRLFRSVNTSGNSALLIFKGNGTTQVNTKLSSKLESYIALDGFLGVGLSSPLSKFHMKGEARIQGTEKTSHFNHSANENTYIRSGKTVGNVIINDTGNRVGIRTASPTSDVHALGSFRLEGTEQASVFNHSTHEHTYIRSGKIGANVFINDQGGDVGIGTTAPTHKLHVEEGSIRINKPGNSTGYMLLTAPNATPGITFYSNQPELYRADIRRGLNGLHFDVGTGADPSTKMTIANTGYVGVGTNTPETRLHVKGTLRAGYLYNNTEYLELSHGGSNGFINMVGDGDIDFRISGNNIMSISPTGAVVIGEPTRPGPYKLYVDGGILAEEVKVALSNSADWSDDAFNDTPTLDAVDESIAQHAHLVGMPSALSLVQSGYSVMHMDSKLLAQIEWLWQHMIIKDQEKDELQEQLHTLNNKMKKLESMIEKLMIENEKLHK